MRYGLKILLLIVCIGSAMFLFKRFYKSTSIKLLDKNLASKIVYKGLAGARDFAFDEKGNTYIAFTNKVQFVDKYGKSFQLFADSNLQITSLVLKDDSLYYISGCVLASYNLNSKTHNNIINSIPNLGDYSESRLLLKDDNIYIAIGAATNSGVVGEDNIWLKTNPFNYDLSPKMLTINGKATSKNKTGAFVPYNTKNVSGQIIPAHFPGNASVTVYNTKSGDTWLLAWGIRNISGIDYNSEGRIFCTVGGMEDRGARPVKGDVDYIYELKETLWYGWPDYSGGDPVSSPRFKGASNEKIPFILDKHPTTNPPAPFYVHKKLSALGALIVDREGSFGEKDSIYFQDIKDNILYEINKGGVTKEKIKFGDGSSIRSIKGWNGYLYFLDSEDGVLVSVGGINDNSNNSKSVMYFVLIGCVLIAGCIIWKLKS